jgi:hypothetical protein
MTKSYPSWRTTKAARGASASFGRLKYTPALRNWSAQVWKQLLLLGKSCARRTVATSARYWNSCVILTLSGFSAPNTHHGVHNLRFPYVSMNLEGLFQQMSIIDSHVVISGIYGLSDALSKIHDFSSVDDNIEIKSIGYHPDLSLANILVEDD